MADYYNSFEGDNSMAQGFDELLKLHEPVNKTWIVFSKFCHKIKSFTCNNKDNNFDRQKNRHVQQLPVVFLFEMSP